MQVRYIVRNRTFITVYLIVRYLLMEEFSSFISCGMCGDFCTLQDMIKIAKMTVHNYEIIGMWYS
jgi:hypothetical protein